jgi:hypothetical protein
VLTIAEPGVAKPTQFEGASMTAPRSNRLQANPNRDTAAGKAKPQAASKVKSAKAGGGQKGTFVGNPKGIHIHIVGANTHVQVGDDRHNFDPKNDGQAKAARTWLLGSGGRGKPGYDDCLTWLAYPKANRV